MLGVLTLDPSHAAVWELAEPHLRVRSTDGRTIDAFGTARALVDLHPDSGPEVVLPAFLLQDTVTARQSARGDLRRDQCALPCQGAV